jgi:hypothetical protein
MGCVCSQQRIELADNVTSWALRDYFRFARNPGTTNRRNYLPVVYLISIVIGQFKIRRFHASKEGSRGAPASGYRAGLKTDERGCAFNECSAT